MESFSNKVEKSASQEKPKSGLESVRERMSSFGDRLKAREQAGLPDVEQSTAEKIGHGARKVADVAGKLGLVFALGMTLNHLRTRNDIHVTAEHGAPHYEHPDERTTRILNFLTGRAELPEGEKIFFYRHLVQDKLEESLMPVPKDINTLGVPALQKLLAEYYQGTPLGVTKSAAEIEKQVAEDFAESVESPGKNSEADSASIYQAIWKLQQRVGAPQIRWAAEGEGFTARLMSESAGEGRAFYDPLMNTVYLTPGNPSHVLVGEDAHAKQFNEHPVSSYTNLAYSWVHSASESVTHFQNIQTTYQAEYKRPGSLEYEAHKVIEPELMKETAADFHPKSDHK